MATFLDLVKAVGRESGTLPNWATLTDLTSPTDRVAKIMAWVAQAWLNIQNERDDWFWMRATGTATLAANTTEYTPSSAPFSLSRFGRWVWDGELDGILPVSLYDSTVGVADEHEIEQVPYGRWFDHYGRGSHDANRPTVWAIGPDGKFLVGAKPDLSTYVCRFHYMKSPQSLSSASDTPEIPARFHPLITYEALRLLSGSDGNSFNVSITQQEIMGLRHDLGRLQLPEVWLGGEVIGL